MNETAREGRSEVEVREDLLNLPFDVYGRHRLAADALRRLGNEGAVLRVLETDPEGELARFLPEADVTRAAPETDATALPHGDGAFDFVVSLDAYGRVEPGDREKHLSELRRVARAGVLLAAPFDSATVRGLRRAAGPGALGPSRERELPDLEDVRRFFGGEGDAVHVLPNGYAPHWLAMACLSRYAGGGRAPDGIDAFYNDAMYGRDNAEPAYRYLVVALKESPDVDLGGLLSPRPEDSDTGRPDLFGALAAALPLAAEAERLRADLARGEGARARAEARADDLSRRLAERVAGDTVRRATAVAELRRERDASQRERDELRRDLNQMRRSRDELRRQITAIQGSRTWRLLGVLRKARMKLARSG